MIFKNPVKDIYYKTEILDSSDNCFYNIKVIMDEWQKEYKDKRELYDEFIKTGIYTTDISNNNSKDFESIRIAINETKEKLKASEKKVVLGTLATEMAHEIQNPLNFVNNFSEVNVELSDELIMEITKPDTDQSTINDLVKTIHYNNQRINENGKRVSAIVKTLQDQRNAMDKT